MNKQWKNQLNDSFFDDINGRKLDVYQRKIVLDNSRHLLVVAGAGSGKTLTIIGKIRYLIEKLHVNFKEILCISFTNETVNNLKQKIGYDIDCFTFHKLALTILKDFNYPYCIASDDLLDYVTDEFFANLVYQYDLVDLVREGLLLKKDDPRTYEQLIQDNSILFSNYKASMKSFIKKIKTNNHGYDDFIGYVRENQKLKNSSYNKSFLIVVFHLLLVYTNELISTNSIDFDDMISLATSLVKKRGIKRGYRYIIIDEFQDTSWVRYCLIQSILNYTKAHLICVGDDYQSIYGFSGCNLDLFINFKKYFTDAKIMYIKNTYRNSYQIINTSCSFIQKNHYQLRKHLHAMFSLTKPIKIVYYDKENYAERFYELLDYLHDHDQKNILVLGRYNKDIWSVIKTDLVNNHLIYLDMDIEYLTVHRSKGLECDNVIILNMSNQLMGFPSQLMDDEVFKVFGREKENFPFASERRLFYVALTRTRYYVYMMVPRSNPSIFVQEIKSKTVELIMK